MNPTKPKLTNPTDDELSGAVAVYIVGTPTGYDYATSADAVLPLLEKCRYITNADFVPTQQRWCVGIGGDSGTAPTFPRAACIALCRANGIEVEQTAQPTRASS